MRLKDRVVLITGASHGIGAACVEEFRLRGARLALTARSEDLLRQIGGADALTIPGDLLDEDHRRTLVERTLAHYGRIDVLVNNAGCGLYGASWNLPLADTRRLFELNFFAAVDLARLSIPVMLKNTAQGGRGSIVNVSSVAGKVTLPWMTSYSASKYALNSFGDGLRMELRGKGISVVNVCPGYVKTEFQKHVIGGRTPSGVARSKQKFAITAQRCAQALVEGVEQNKRTVVTPRVAWMLVVLERVLPWMVHAQFARMLEGKDGQGG